MAAQLELAQRPFVELQIEALADENRIQPERALKFIKTLESRLLAIEKLNCDKILGKTLRLPILGRPNSLNDDYPKNFKFIPPEQLHVIGGLKTLTALKQTNYIDLALIIPSKCFEKKDVKNQRYHHKRALYLAQIAHLLNGPTGSGLVGKLEYRYYQGDFLKPVVLITAKSPKLEGVVFQMFACPESSFAIKVSLLQPDHGNVAPKWFFKDYDFDKTDESIVSFIEADSDVAPSPFYNSSLLFDIEATTNSGIVSEHIGTETSISEALLLMKIWLYQRELHQQFSFIVSMFVAYLQTKQKIYPNMSSMQIFRIIIKTLIDTDWLGSGLSYFEDDRSKIPAFKAAFPVIFLSPSGNLNLCYNITTDLYHRLRHEALNTQSILSRDDIPEIFELLFLKKIDFINKFDVIVHLPKCTKRVPEKLDYLKRFMDHGVFVPRVYSENILNLVSRALTDRVTLIQQSPDNLLLDKKWNLKGISYDPTNQAQTFSFGLLLDAEKSLRIIDIGPEAQRPEAEEFRQFWEPKCQLRLQDGVISETVVWHIENFSQRRTIIKYMLTHALKQAKIKNVVVHYTLLERFINLQNVHFKWRDDVVAANSKENIQNLPQKRKHEPNYDDDDDADPEPDSDHSDNEANDSKNNREIQGKPIGVGEEVFQKVLHSYNELNKVLRSFDNLKHSITSIHPMSSHLRASSVFPPLPVSLQSRNKSLKRRKGVTSFPDDFSQIGKILNIEPVDILLTLDSTGQWPNDLKALEAAKLDYLLQLGESLKAREYSVKFSDEEYMDVLHGQFVFRISVKCSKELSLVAAAKGKLESQKRRLELEIMPRIHASLDQLYRERPAFGLTCRLVKRWIACHLMTDHISETALELIVAHLFLHPLPCGEPASSACGFRRFLALIATHDWKEFPLVVNFDNQLKIDEIKRMKAQMLESRSKYPPLVICTPYDKEQHSPWTQSEPDEKNLELLCSICTKGLQFLTDKIMAKFYVVDECKSLFRPNFKLFDLIIKLHPRVVQTFFMSIDHQPKEFKLVGKEPLQKRSSAFKVMPIVGLNVVDEFAKSLKGKFGDVAWFFHDKYGQRVIGVIMKPESEKKLDGDMKKFIGDIRKLGSKIVDTVKILKHEKRTLFDII